MNIAKWLNVDIMSRISLHWKTIFNCILKQDDKNELYILLLYRSLITALFFWPLYSIIMLVLSIVLHSI